MSRRRRTLHGVGDAREDGWRDVVALVAKPAASEQALGTLGLARLDVAHDLLELRDSWGRRHALTRDLR